MNTKAPLSACRSALLWTTFALAATACTETKPPAPPAAKQAMPVYNADALTAACDTALTNARKNTASLSATPLSEMTLKTFLEAWDENGAAIGNVLGPIYLQAYVHPKEAVREAGQKCILEVSKFQTALFQNEALYQRLNQLDDTNLDPVSEQLKADLAHAFTISGVTLPLEKRQRAAEITETVDRLAEGFQAALRENTGHIVFQESDVAGLSDTWKDQARQPDGSYQVGFDYPQYFPFMRNASNSDARKRYYQGFTQRGGTKNLERLDEIVALRQALADLHGVASYADLATRNRMLNSPAQINQFLAQVAEPVLALEKQDLAELEALRREMHPGASGKLQRWDLPYYLEKARQQKFDVDQEALRQYFPTKATVQWALEINEALLGIDIRPAEAETWHADVLYYDVYDATSDDFLGAMYLDLYPRDGKYKHAAAFPVRSGSRLLGQRPTSALVTNFDRNGLTQQEVETLLHELGHVFHGVLSNTWYASHSGTEVKRDFVEAPSQMLEAWARRYETLSKVANHCDNCPKISKEMVSKLEAARTFGQGSFYARQHLYASFDMQLAMQAPPSAQQLWAKMEGRSALGHLPGTQFPGTFGHITKGYVAGYYGYMWSEVLSLDMQSLFGDNLMNSTLGQRYRQEILARGGEAPPAELVRNFLGREPSSKAFFKQFQH